MKPYLIIRAAEPKAEKTKEEIQREQTEVFIRNQENLDRNSNR